jgi:hypothetical protein
MSKIENKCREVIDKGEWVAIATSGTEGPHLAATWGEYIRALGIADEGTLFIPVGGYQTTERNLGSDNRIELLCATKQVQGAHGPGKGCRIRGTGQIQTSGDQFAATKKIFSWARGVLVVKVEEVSAQL